MRRRSPTESEIFSRLWVEKPLSSAVATGIRVNSGINNLTISNSGSINVDAITANGGNAEAYGIRLVANGDVTPTADDVTTINNSGGSGALSRMTTRVAAGMASLLTGRA